uniref:Uncharacterized protein n=1 Tax=Caenorhabditis japonica TaxID=281687 RepID=A0A8R1IEK6_CAEJA
MPNQSLVICLSLLTFSEQAQLNVMQQLRLSLYDIPSFVRKSKTVCRNYLNGLLHYGELDLNVYKSTIRNVIKRSGIIVRQKMVKVLEIMPHHKTTQ